MVKHHSQNQDYFKVSGGSPGRSSYERERRKLASEGDAGPKAPRKAPAVARTGAGAETAARAQKRREEKLEVQVEREEVQRAVEATVAPAAPVDRQLPAARMTTALEDLRRDVWSEVTTAWRSARQLAASLSSLARSPVRLYRVFRPAESA